MFQTRSKETGIANFPTFKQALEHANKDLTVWKISFSVNEMDRIRLVRTVVYPTMNPNGDWVLTSIEDEMEKK